MKTPIPRPTEIKHNRMRCGQRKFRTVEEIIYDMEFQLELERKNLGCVIE